MAKKRILVLSGPNFDMLGRRQPDIYGTGTLADLEELTRATGEELGFDITFLQSNFEGVLIEAIHDAMDGADAVLINPGGYGYSSVSLLDALAMLSIPVIEVHLSRIHAREEFRRHPVISPAVAVTIVGAGFHGYVLGLHHLSHLFEGE